jgi:hypothetical protein
MSRNHPTRRRRRSLITWGLIIVSAGIAFVLGVVGYAEYYAPRLDTSPPPSFLDLVQDSARLLVTEWGDSAGDTMPKTLQMARWFALLSWSAAAIKGLLNFASKQVQLIRCRLHRNHAIVCGLGRQGLQLVSDLTAQGINVIAIELDPDNSQIANVKSEGVPVLMGNAADPVTLTDAAAKRARFIFAVAGDDKVNIEIATKAFGSRSARSNGGRTQRCAVHIDNAEISGLFSERPLFKTTTDDFDAHFFNINRLAARTLVDRYPPDRFQEVHGPDDPPASIMVFGTEMLAQELVSQIARVGHYGNRKKPIIQLLTGEENRVSKSVEKRAAVLSEFVELDIDDNLDFELLLTNDDLLEGVVTRHQPSIVYICLSNAVDSLRLVAGLQRVGVARRAELVVCTTHRSDFTFLAPSVEGPDDLGFAVFDVMRETCTVENIMRERLDNLARAIHRDYVARQTELGKTVETNRSLVSWNALPETFREANRNQADHVAVKLRVLGYDSPSIPPPCDLQLTEPQLELIAELEHRRWLAGKMLAGWRYTSGPKDAARRIAPTIVGWDALTEEEKGKDRDTARDLPRLSEMKLALEREQT